MVNVEVEVDQEVTGEMNEAGEVVLHDKQWKNPPAPPAPQSSSPGKEKKEEDKGEKERGVLKTSSGTVVPPTASEEDPEVLKTVEEFEKAAIAQIDDEEYWDDLMERGKLLKLIDTPFQAPLGDDLFGSIRKNNIDQVGA